MISWTEAKLSFIISSFLAICTAFSYAELSSIFPKGAAEYVYVKNSFGKLSISIFVGCLTIFAGIVSASAVARGFQIIFQYFYLAILQFFFPYY